MKTVLLLDYFRWLLIGLLLCTAQACNQPVAPLVGTSDVEDSREQSSLPGASQIPVANITSEDEENVSEGAEIATDVVGSYMSLSYGVNTGSKSLRYDESQTDERSKLGRLTGKSHIRLTPSSPELIGRTDIGVFYHTRSAKDRFTVGVIPASALQYQEGQILAPLRGVGDYQIGLLSETLEEERSYELTTALGGLAVPPMRLAEKIDLGKRNLTEETVLKYPYLASVDRRGRVQLFDLGGLDPQDSFKDDFRLGGGDIKQVDISSDDKMVIANDLRIRIVDLKDNSTYRNLNVPGFESFSLSGSDLYIARKQMSVGEDGQSVVNDDLPFALSRVSLASAEAPLQDMGSFPQAIDQFFVMDNYIVLTSEGDTYRMELAESMTGQTPAMVKTDFAPTKVVRKGDRRFFLDPDNGLAAVNGAFEATPNMALDLSVETAEKKIQAAAYQKKLRFLSFEEALQVYDMNGNTPRFEAKLEDIILLQPVNDILVNAVSADGTLYRLEIRNELR